MVRNGEHMCSHKVLVQADEKTISEDECPHPKKSVSFQLDNPIKLSTVREEVSCCFYVAVLKPQELEMMSRAFRISIFCGVYIYNLLV